MSSNLRNITLFILAIISSVANFEGLNQIIQQDDWWWKTFTLLISIGVAAVIYLFWSHAFYVVVEVQRWNYRLSAWGIVALACAFLIALSSWWNVTALAANEVLRLVNKDIIAKAETAFNTALQENGKYQSFVPEISSLAQNLNRLATAEEQTGSLTGSPGKGGVAGILRQLEAKAQGLVTAAQSTSGNIEALRAKGQNCLNQLRENLNSNQQVSKYTDCVNSVISDLGNQDALQLIQRNLSSFTSGVVLPVSLKKNSQKKAAARVMVDIKAHAEQIAKSVTGYKSQTVAPVKIRRINAMWAVITYAHAVLPAWITGISLDLAPLVLLGFLVIYRRDADARGASRYHWTIGELLDAKRQLALLEAPDQDILHLPVPLNSDKGDNA